MNVYEIVTNRILSELEKGKIPWHKPWKRVNKGGEIILGGAYNHVTGHRYSLLNQLLLMHDDAYLTFKQVQSLGGKVNKGAQSEIVVFWKMLHKEEENASGEKEEKLIPMLRYYNVFWIGDTNIERKEKPEEKIIIPDNLSNHEQNDMAEKLIEDYVSREGITLVNQYESDEAYYMPSLDLVNVPMMEQFYCVEEYYGTMFHELTHSTGKAGRLNRLGDKRVKFGDSDYSKEELVAELGSSTLVNFCGMETEKSFRNNVAYIQSWIRALQNDKRLIVSASSKAEKAVAYILGDNNVNTAIVE